MSTTNQYSKLFQVLSQALDVRTVPEVIGALNTLLSKPAGKQSAKLSKKRQVAYYSELIANGIRGTKPEYLKKRDKKR